MIELKGGHTTEDPRLDRLPEWDVRNENFPIRELLTARQIKKPRSYTWFVPMRNDQGQEGRCVEYAFCHELCGRPVTVSETIIRRILANREIYWPAQEQDQWPGGSYPGAVPFYEGTSGLAAAKVATNLGFYKEYRWALNLEDLILGVGYKGPAAIGIDWHGGMFDTDDQGFINMTGGVAGGHEVLLNGVDLKRECFNGVNSWGDSFGFRNKFGQGGNFRLRFADADDLIFNHYGDAMIPVYRLKGK